MPMSAWGKTSERFAKDFTVIMWDYPGLGKSSKLTHEYTMLDLAHDSASLLNYLKVKRVNVIGYSMGGIVAQHLGISYKGLVKKIVFLASTPLSNSVSWINPEARAKMTEETDPSKLIRILINYAFNKQINKCIYGILDRLYAASLDKDAVLKMYNATAGPETWAQLPTLSAEKALALNGTKDRIINYNAGAALASRIPKGTADVIVEGSHALLQEFKKVTENKLDRFFTS